VKTGNTRTVVYVTFSNLRALNKLDCFSMQRVILHQVGLSLIVCLSTQKKLSSDILRFFQFNPLKKT